MLFSWYMYNATDTRMALHTYLLYTDVVKHQLAEDISLQVQRRDDANVGL